MKNILHISPTNVGLLAAKGPYVLIGVQLKKKTSALYRFFTLRPFYLNTTPARGVVFVSILKRTCTKVVLTGHAIRVHKTLSTV